ncbi:MAG: hypothetical protein K6B28_04855 [Lachnospiraceae bacterium]|nr:hypothetical protein [Lachnospiraceae bacterium]
MNRNLNFFLKFLLALLPVLFIILYTAFFPMYYQDTDYPSWKYTKDIQSGKGGIYGDGEGKGGEEGYREKDFKTIIIGDSAAMADLKPTCMSDDCINLAIGGATSIEMYYTLRDYIENVGCPENVVIMFSPFHYSYIDNYWTRSIYFHHFSITDAIKTYTEGRKLKADTFNDGEHDLFSLLSMYLRLPDSYLPALINARFFLRYEDNSLRLKELDESRGQYHFGTMDGCDYLNYESNYTEFKTDGDHPILDEYMIKILRLCQENAVNITVSQPPMNTASYESLNDDYLSQYFEYIEGLSVYYPEGIYETEIPEYDNKYFGDASHLNDEGAKKFSEEFALRYKDMF